MPLKLWPAGYAVGVKQSSGPSACLKMEELSARSYRPTVPQVLEGYMFLGNVEQLGDEVKAAFVNAVNTAVQKVG